MDGQSSRASLRLPPEIFPIKSGEVNSFTRRPCTGHDQISCSDKPDFYLVCSKELGCYGCIQNYSFVKTLETGAEDSKLGGALGHFFYISILGNFIIPTGFHSYFSGWGMAMYGYQPPPRVFDEVALFPGEVAGGTAAQGSGGVGRRAGHGGNGRCSAVRRAVHRVVGRRVQVLPSQGAPGRPGVVSIRGCTAGTGEYLEQLE